MSVDVGPKCTLTFQQEFLENLAFWFIYYAFLYLFLFFCTAFHTNTPCLELDVGWWAVRDMVWLYFLFARGVESEYR